VTLAARPLQREIRVLVRALIVFLFTLIVALLALVLTLLGSSRPWPTPSAKRSRPAGFWKNRAP